MTSDAALDSTSPTERVVLYELATFAEEDRTPVRVPTVLQQCRDRLETVDAVVTSRVSEADVASRPDGRALSNDLGPVTVTHR